MRRPTPAVKRSCGWQWHAAVRLADTDSPDTFNSMAGLFMDVIDDLARQRTPAANAEIADICDALSCHGLSVGAIQIAAEGEPW